MKKILTLLSMIVVSFPVLATTYVQSADGYAGGDTTVYLGEGSPAITFGSSVTSGNYLDVWLLAEGDGATHAVTFSVNTGGTCTIGTPIAGPTMLPDVNGIHADGGWSIVSAGTGYVDGTYTAVPLSGGSGTGALATVIISGGAISDFYLVYGGNGYTTSDTGLTISNAHLGGSGSGISISVTGTQTLDFDVHLFLVPITGTGSCPLKATYAGTADLYLQANEVNGLAGTYTSGNWTFRDHNTSATTVVTLPPLPALSGSYYVIARSFSNDLATLPPTPNSPLTQIGSGFLQEKVGIAGHYIVQNGYSSVTSSPTIQFTQQTDFREAVYYVAAYAESGGGASCTNSGWSLTGVLSVPTAGSGSFWKQNGSSGTVDCSSQAYWQSSGVFGSN